MIQKIRMDMSIGSNIQKMRYQNKLTQEQVIARMNLMGLPISKSSYAKIETNRMNIKVSELMALADIFHCEVGDFFKDLIKIIFRSFLLLIIFSFSLVHYGLLSSNSYVIGTLRNNFLLHKKQTLPVCTQIMSVISKLI